VNTARDAHVSKNYGEVHALRDVELSVVGGELRTLSADLLALAVVLPLAAAGAGWLLGGRPDRRRDRGVPAARPAGLAVKRAAGRKIGVPAPAVRGTVTSM
jgi:hypothetical protein